MFFLYKILAKFLTGFGSIKVFKFPMFIVYDPSYFKMDGVHVRKALSVLKPGDVILRGYDNYLDGWFIDDEFKYSHGAIYIGNNQIVHAVAEGVSKIDVLDFMQCDRICIFRPAACQEEAIEKAEKFVEDNIPYDFIFQKGDSALYCFELAAECYKKLNVQKIKIKKLFGLLHKNVYLARSFRDNDNFKCVFEYNPRFNIDV